MSGCHTRHDAWRRCWIERLGCFLSAGGAAPAANVDPAAAALPARQVEALGCGIVAVNKRLTPGQTSRYNIYISWRLLGTDPGDISFNLYRIFGTGSALKLNASPITTTTDYTDTNVNIFQANK
jgi:rhamnogalacturonan endolyase